MRSINFNSDKPQTTTTATTSRGDSKESNTKQDISVTTTMTNMAGAVTKQLKETRVTTGDNGKSTRPA